MITLKDVIDQYIDDPELSAGISYPYPFEFPKDQEYKYMVDAYEMRDYHLCHSIIPALKEHKEVFCNCENNGQRSFFRFAISADNSKWRRMMIKEAIEL